MDQNGNSINNTIYGDGLVTGNEQINGNLNVGGTITGGVVSDPVITNDIQTLTPGGTLSIKNSSAVTHATFADNGLFSVNTMAGYSNSLLLADNLGNTQLQLNNGAGSVTAGVRILNGSKLNVDQIESQSFETANNPTINMTNTSINIVNVPLQAPLLNTTSVKAINAAGITLKKANAGTVAQVNDDGSFQIGPYKMPTTAGANTNLLQTDGSSQASWVPIVNGISNVVQEEYLYTMSPTDPLSDFLYYQSTNGAADNNFFQNYPLTAIQAYSSAVTDNFTYTFNEGSTNYLVFGAAPGAFNQNPGTRVIPSVLAGQTSSPNIAHMVKILSIPNPDIYTKFSLKLSINSCWNPPSTLAIYAVYNDVITTPVYGVQYVNTSTAAGQYVDILMNDQPFGNILRTQQYDAFTSIRPSNYDFEYPLNTAAISVFQAVSIVISLTYANNGNTNPATLITPTGAGVISTNYTQNYGLEITRMAIIAYAISNGTGTLTTNHDLLSNLNTQSHPQYLTLDGTRPMTGGLAMGTNAITGLTNLQSAPATNLGLYHDTTLIASVTGSSLQMAAGLNMNTNAITNATTVNATTFTGALTGHASADLRIDGTSTMTGALNMGSHRINNVTDPSSTQDAATKNYVDVHAPYTNIIYRPGGVAGGNIFITWAGVIAKAATLNNAVNIFIDDSLSTPALIDVSYDFGGTTNILSYSDNVNTVNTCQIIDTVTISNPRSFGGILSVACIALTTPSIQIDNSRVLIIDTGATLTNANTATVSAINVPTTASIILTNGANINNNGPPIFILPSSSGLTLDINLLSAIQNDSVSSIDGSSTLSILYDASFNAVALTNAGFTGTLTLIPYDQSVNVVYNDGLVSPAIGATTAQGAIDILKSTYLAANGSILMTGDLNADAYNIGSVATLGTANIQMVGGNINCDTQSILNSGGMNPASVGYQLVLGNPTDQISLNGPVNFQGNLNINGNQIFSSVQTAIVAASVDSAGTANSSFNCSITKTGTGVYDVTFGGIITPIYATYQIIISAEYSAGAPIIAGVDYSSKTTSGFTYYTQTVLGIAKDSATDFIVLGSN